MPHRLSKSRYVSGLQCPKILWLNVNSPDLAAETDIATERLFDVGRRVGEYAQKLFKNGVLIAEGREQLSRAIKKTRQHIDADTTAIYEATVEYRNILCRADILKRVGKKENLWDIYEVKSGTSVHDPYYDDVAVQRYCFEGAGYPIRRTFLTHINTDYIRRGEIEPAKLLISEEITDQVNEKLTEVETRAVDLLKAMNASDCPAIEPGPQCTQPYTCAFYDHCNQPSETDPFSIHELVYGRRAIPALEAMGITRLVDIPDDFRLSRRNRRHVDSVKSMKPVVDKKSLKAKLAELVYPLYFFDFETANCAIPLFDQSSPYQNIPFQYSLHIQSRPNGPCDHREFLLLENQDPRPQIIQTMLEYLGHEGSIVVYNASFERGCIKHLARDFPRFKTRLLALVPRLWDLIVPFRSGDYAHYAFHGSASLKAVLPALVSDLSYDELEIRDGGSASLIATRFYDNDLPAEQWAEKRPALLKYCGLDTLSMVEILRVLYRAVEE